MFNKTSNKIQFLTTFIQISMHQAEGLLTAAVYYQKK